MTDDVASVGDLRPTGSAERLAVGFVTCLRDAGIVVPIHSSLTFAEALGETGIESRDRVYWSARATLVRRPEDIEVFDRVFSTFWLQREPRIIRVEQEPPSLVLAVDDSETPGADDAGAPPDDDGDEMPTLRFSRTEVLTDKDFAECDDDELDELGRLMTTLRFSTETRPSRRRVPARSGDRHDLRRTVRTAMRHGGEPVRRHWTTTSERPRRMVFLLDVSGSMEAYARGLIRFCHAAVVARGRVEAFTFGTRLTRVTRQLGSRDPDRALAAAAAEMPDWAGGTRLGEVVQRFNDEWGIRGMARGSIVVILSDGWDRGEAALLGEQMERLHRVTHRLVWVNPLKATPGYAPLAAGMAAALPHVDDFVEGHSFSSLADLAVRLTTPLERGASPRI